MLASLNKQGQNILWTRKHILSNSRSGENMVTNISAKFNYDRLHINKALAIRRTTTFLVIYGLD